MPPRYAVECQSSNERVPGRGVHAGRAALPVSGRACRHGGPVSMARYAAAGRRRAMDHDSPGRKWPLAASLLPWARARAS